MLAPDVEVIGKRKRKGDFAPRKRSSRKLEQIARKVVKSEFRKNIEMKAVTTSPSEINIITGAGTLTTLNPVIATGTTSKTRVGASVRMWRFGVNMLFLGSDAVAIDAPDGVRFIITYSRDVNVIANYLNNRQDFYDYEASRGLGVFVLHDDNVIIATNKLVTSSANLAVPWGGVPPHVSVNLMFKLDGRRQEYNTTTGALLKGHFQVYMLGTLTGGDGATCQIQTKLWYTDA